MMLAKVFVTFAAAVGVLAQSSSSSGSSSAPAASPASVGEETTTPVVTPASSAAPVAATGAPDPMINTPTGVQQCLPIQLTFSGSAPPFIITIVPGGQESAAPLVTVGTTFANALTWVANLQQGTSCTAVIRDSQGRIGASAPFTILAGNTNCPLSQSGSGATAAVGSSSSAAAGGGATTPAASTSHPVSTTAAAPAATTTKKSGASALQPVGVVGGLVAVGIAILL